MPMTCPLCKGSKEVRCPFHKEICNEKITCVLCHGSGSLDDDIVESFQELRSMDIQEFLSGEDEK